MNALDSDIRARFLGGMSQAACTVNVVTTDGEAGRAGVTVSAMSSVSADTPLPTLLVCVHEMSPAADTILENGVFCVNVLRDDQSYISDTFAGRFKDQVEDKFDCADWTVQKTGAPRVVDPLVAFDCRLVSHDKVGTHYVMFGEVQDIFSNRSGSPLLYSNRAYGAANRIETADTIKAGQEAEQRKLSLGCFHTFAPHHLPRLIEGVAKKIPGLDLNLIEGDQRRMQGGLLAGELDVALLYDLDISPELDTEFLMDVVPQIVLSEGHELASCEAIDPADLEPLPMVMLNAPPSPDYFQNIMDQAGLKPNIAFRSSSLETVRGFVGRGLGYSLLATKPANMTTYDGGRLVCRPLKADLTASRIVLAHRSGIQLSKPAEAFKSVCLELLNT